MTTVGGNFNGIGMTSARTRARMVERVREQGVKDEAVLAALGSVPRHIFVEEALAIRAYEDSPLPIGSGQTISQPYIVARMTELLRAGGQLHRVLEIGADGGKGLHPQCEEVAVIIERKFGFGDIVARLRIAQESLGARAHPFHRAAGEPRGQRGQHLRMRAGPLSPGGVPDGGLGARVSVQGPVVTMNGGVSAAASCWKCV